MDEPEHTKVTRRNAYRYLFIGKHHGGGSSTDASWCITRDEEFGVFDVSDFAQICDDGGWMYGVLPEEGKLRDIGTWDQQIAVFPLAPSNMPWHGYPLHSVNNDAPENRSGQKMRPAKTVFDQLESSMLITRRQRKRLWNGKHA